jgi:hypothetical protein
MSKNWHPIAILLAGIAVSQLSVGIATVRATDGVNGTAGPAMIDIDTGQLFDSQHPDHVIVAGDQTMTLTGHGTVTLTNLGGGTLYGANGIGFVNTSTMTVTGTYTDTTTATIPVTQTTTANGTGDITASTSTTGTGTETQSVTVLFPDLFTATYTGTPPTTTGTSTRTNSRTYATTVTVTLASTLTTTASATGTGTGTATGTGTGTGTVSGSATGTQTASGTTTVSVTGSGATTETVSNTQTFLGTTMTVTGTKTWTASRSQVATATQNTISTTATGTGTGTWTNTNTATAHVTGTFTATNTFTVTTTSNSASVGSNPTVAQTNRIGAAYMLDLWGCSEIWNGGICPLNAWSRTGEAGGTTPLTINSSSGVTQFAQSLYYYRNSSSSYGYYIWPSGTWTLRVRASATSLQYASYIRAEVIVVGIHDAGAGYNCAGSVYSVVPTGTLADIPISAPTSSIDVDSLAAVVGGISVSMETGVKNFVYEPNYPTGWNTQCTNSSSATHPPVLFGLRVSAYTESPSNVTVTLYTIDIDSPVPAMP